MKNPFEIINVRLTNIESLLIYLKHKPNKEDTSSSSPKFLTITEASSYVSLSVQTLYDKCHKKSIPHIKKGGRLYFIESDLYEYINSGKKKTIEEIKEEANSFITKLKKG